MVMSGLSRKVGMKSIIDASGAMLLKVFGAGGTFVVFALVSRTMDVREFGILTSLFSLVGFISVAVLFGQESQLVRSWVVFSDDIDSFLSVFFVSWFVILFFVLLSSFVFYVLSYRHGVDFSGYLVVSFIFQSFLNLSLALVRVVRGVIVSDMWREVVWKFFIVGFILLFPYYFHSYTFFVIVSLISFFGLLHHFYIFYKSFLFKIFDFNFRFDFKNWFVSSFHMWMSSLAPTASQFLDSFFVLFLLGPVDAAIYFVAQRFASIFSVFGSGVMLYLSPHLAGVKSADSSHKAIFLMSVFSLMIASFGFAFVVFFGRFLLSFFGHDFLVGYNELVLLSFGNISFLLAGPSQQLLLLRGHEKLCSGISTLFFVVRTFGLFGGSLWGGDGVALMVASISVLFSLIFVFVTRAVSPLDPSVFSLFSLVGSQKVKG